MGGDIEYTDELTLTRALEGVARFNADRISILGF